MSKYRYLKTLHNNHTDLKVPVSIISSATTHGGIEYIVYSPITGKTFAIKEDDTKMTPPDSEYVVDATVNVKSYYKGKSSLYKFAEEWNLNAWEFDIIKRVCRCRHKGNFVEDLQKTKDLIDIYLKEHSIK